MDDDAPERLSAIDHRLHQISTHLAATLDQLPSQLAAIHANLETLIESLGSAEPIKTGAARGLPDSEPPPSPTATGGHSVPPGGLAEGVQALAALLAQVVELAADRAVFPGYYPQIAEQAMEHGCVCHAVCAPGGRLR